MTFQEIPFHGLQIIGDSGVITSYTYQDGAVTGLQCEITTPVPLSEIQEAIQSMESFSHMITDAHKPDKAMTCALIREEYNQTPEGMSFENEVGPLICEAAYDKTAQTFTGKMSGFTLCWGSFLQHFEAMKRFVYLCKEMV